MALFGSPAPQWMQAAAVAKLASLVLVLDVDGYYRLYQGVPATGYFEDDGTGTIRIVASAGRPMKIAKNMTSGLTYIY